MHGTQIDLTAVFCCPIFGETSHEIMLRMFDWRHSTENLNIVLLSFSSVLPADKWQIHQFNYSFPLNLFLFNASF